jgi:FKBP-type peptidyl-prolyl cis-trans isomerase
MYKTGWIILLVIFILPGCNKQKYPGYDKTSDGIYYKLLTISESDKRPVPGDYITVDLTYKTINDSVFFSGRRKFQLTPPVYPGSVEECFRMLAPEESASFILPASDFFNKTLKSPLPPFLCEADPMKIEIAMVEIQTVKEYRDEKQAFLKWIDDFGAYEKEILKQYLTKNQMNIKPAAPGLYYFRLKEGSGKKVELGDTVTVNYEGKFLNGKFFDSTVKRKEPFSFVYGQEWQVIEGMEEAIGMMREGEKALFIMRSDLAFGETGSSTGIIPPFTSLIFEVELVSVK